MLSLVAHQHLRDKGKRVKNLKLSLVPYRVQGQLGPHEKRFILAFWRPPTSRISAWFTRSHVFHSTRPSFWMASAD